VRRPGGPRPRRRPELREAKHVIAAGDRAGRRADHAEIVVDPDRAGSALSFPAEAEERDGYEALGENGPILCPAFIAHDFA
jgi:hypothetical protein